METTMNKHSKGWFSDRTRKITVDVICYLFVLLFLYAATSKLMEYDKFQLQMGKSPIITDYASILVWLVPGLEIAISITLLLERTRLAGLYAAFTLMALFTFYIYAILSYSDSIPCSCGGVLQKMTWDQHLVFNIIFVVLGIIGILLQGKINEKKIVH
ncbi:putative membrane protein YphA (DoxX/SURF4 family) [Pedobacter africanus]|uniref:Membrane protein YphA (DoxX/SURF4 family) n=1 Tax=Pedobacter africanus TaxID=151894 RepID=A0ACC6KSZ3_9SPHI|nr:MauE/DoxX family redox-associated membrane protein [Pedobacter africanus]MDR6782337.1 putative membrane protein YphA (DoxX/SURF4 family) [Pedobacter africanus]